VSADKKQMSSSDGMQKTVETSQLLKYRAEQLIPSALRQMKEAIKDRDFHRFAELTMKVCPTEETRGGNPIHDRDKEG